MRISDAIPANAGTVKLSICGEYLAFGYSNELKVVRMLDQVTVFSASCSGKITAVDWSPDSDHVLCVIPSKNSVEAFSLSSPQWTCVIKENACGLHSAFWSPGAAHIVTVAEQAVRLAVWSVVARSVAFIETPLMKEKDELAFSPDGKYLAVLMGEWEEYHIVVYSTSSWIVSRRIACTNDISIPKVPPLWSPDGRYLAIWETLDLRKSALEIYSIRDGEKVGDFNTEPGNRMRGISSVVWSPSSQFLLIGCGDERIYVLNYITWGVIGVFDHLKVVEDGNCEILQEIQSPGGFLVVRERPVKFTFVVTRPRRLPGVSRILFASNGVHVASQTSLLPAVVWLWNMEEFALMAIIAFGQEVADFSWRPSDTSLLACGKSSRVSLWRPSKMSQLDLCALGFRGHLRKSIWCPVGGEGADNILLFTPSSFYILSNFG